MNIQLRRVFLCLLAFLPFTLFAALWSPLCSGVARADAGNRGVWGDQGDGSYTNPILAGDFSDPDVIRVGKDYYLITSTFQYSPGMAILHSRDLVNWQYIGHAVQDITQIGPNLNWDHMDRYNRGIYAGALRYHAGRFWIFFTTLDEGVFMTTAKNAAGPWEPLHQLTAVTYYDDPCPFWDDDGKAYLLLSRPGGQWWTHLYGMSPDGRTLDLSDDTVIDYHRGSEGNKIYKIGGKYYIFHNELREGSPRFGVMMRTKTLRGPWEEKIVLHNAPGKTDREPNQGGLVQTEKGDWWFITQQGLGDWDGRPSSLLPVHWVEGWPILGAPDKDGIGTLIWTAKKPMPNSKQMTLQTRDEFSARALGAQWEWNYQPRPGGWSLTERPGSLRLHAFRPLRPGDLFKAADTLTQRVIGYQGGTVITKLETNGMTDGQTAGLTFFWKDWAMLGVKRTGGTLRIHFDHNGSVIDGPMLTTPNVWLKSLIDDSGGSVFAYSLDGKKFTSIGDRFAFGWANYRGVRVGLYCWNDEADTGYADFDWFHYDLAVARRS